MATTYPPIPDDVVKKARYAVIGGSGVTVAGEERFSFETPLGKLINISFLDDDKRVVFVNRHLCTKAGDDGKATYAPPHEVDFHRIILGLKSLNAKGVVAIGSTGTLRPEAVPVGSIVMPDDYAFTLPAPVTFWGKLPMGAFDPADGEFGRIHFTPASADDAEWVGLRSMVQAALLPKLPDAKGKIAMAAGQTEAGWPCVGDTSVDSKAVSLCYVQTTGPRFETRSEIQQYAKLGHIVGMTCSSEWTLAQELVLPYALVCAVDNSANGLSSYPGGPLKEYLDHKGVIADVTGMLVKQLAAKLAEKAASA